MILCVFSSPSLLGEGVRGRGHKVKERGLAPKKICLKIYQKNNFC
jgi:hypothetical protein